MFLMSGPVLYNLLLIYSTACLTEKQEIDQYRAPGDKKQQDMGLDVGTRNGLLSVRTVHTYLYS